MAEIITEQQEPETLVDIMEDVRPTYTGHPSAGEPAVEEPPEKPPIKLPQHYD